MNKKYILLFAAAVITFEVARYFYFKPKFKAGENIENFSSNLLNGENFNLIQLKGNYVLLDFWGSWCGPCRKENPALVNLYNDFNGKTFDENAGFEIVSVGIETNEKNWKKAIENDGLKWKYHVIQDDKFNSEIPKKYGVNEIPTKYLLDKQNKVMLVNPTIEEIKTFLNGKLVSQ